MSRSVLAPQGIVTPEAVRLDFRPAGVGSRAVALLLDLMLLVAVQLLVGIAMVLARAWLTPLTVVSILGFVLLVYPVVFEVAWQGRTPGKAALGLRVVTVEGAPVGLRHAVIRSAFGLIDIYATIGAVAVVSALVTRRHQRLGDLVAGTIVLRERSGDPPPEPLRLQVPVGWEAYAATLDPAALDHADYEVIRAFLLRTASLDPAARIDVARALADPVAARLHHRPPAGVSAELFLVCLAARYQQRVRRTGTAT